MATKKISDFTATTTPTSSAIFAIVQGTSNLKVTLANISANFNRKRRKDTLLGQQEIQ